METQRIDYHQQEVKVYSEGTGEVLLFLHGWPTNSRLWDAQVEALKTDYKIIRLDWLGFGKSDKPKNHHYTFTKMKEILDLVINKMIEPDQKINIIAHDIGGPPAILWTSENQNRVKHLILLNTVIYTFSTLLDRFSHFFFTVPLIGQIMLSHFGLKQILYVLSANKRGLRTNRLRHLIEWHENFDYQIKLKTILEPVHEGKKMELNSLESKYREIASKKSLIIAKRDPLCYQHMKKLKEQNPEVPVYFIEQCGHFIPLDRPKELNERLVKILKE